MLRYCDTGTTYVIVGSLDPDRLLLVTNLLNKIGFEAKMKARRGIVRGMESPATAIINCNTTQQTVTSRTRFDGVGRFVL